jgi:phosphatidylserine/phosphatidylglycerophosphate/cardiolipin synthase-like enzyme
VDKARHEERFPVYRSLLNALHKGLAVFIVTNDYEEPVCDGLITPLDLLKVAGAKVRYYTSTTFNHLKFVSVDGKKASVSSINYSFTSFMKNREAG